MARRLQVGRTVRHPLKVTFCVRGVLSPLLANIYLHELDKFAENSLRANAKESKKESNARRSPEYRRIDNEIRRLRIRLAEPDLNGVLPGMASPKAQIAKRLKKLEKARKAIPSHKTQKRIGYVRYADDYLITLQQYSKAEAEELKAKIGQFLKTHLGLEQNVEKTLITHPTKKAKYLGYDLRSGGGRSKRVRLEIPKGARDDLLERTGRLCRLHHIDETDLILKVSDSVRGWMNYYRYASAPQRVFSGVISKVLWQVAHYLAAKHKTSIPKILRKYSQTVTKGGRTRMTLERKTGNKAIYLWMFPPKTESIYEIRSQTDATDTKPVLVHEWANGRSIEGRMEALQKANHQCQVCGSTDDLQVHHIGGLRGKPTTKRLAEAGKAKRKITLCRVCHVKVGHGGSFKPVNRGNDAA